MSLDAARVPLFLELEDVVAWGCSATDLLCIFAGAVLSWWLYLTPAFPAGVRVALCALTLSVAFAFGLVRWEGIALREWAAIAGRFAVRPRELVIEDER